jgi:putative aldouronate transport system substrate-binding protein
MKKRIHPYILAACLLLPASLAWAAGSGEKAPAAGAPVVVTVFAGGNEVFGSADPIWANNPVGKYITEKTGIQVKIDNPTGSNADEKLNLLLASGNAPEVFVTGSMATVSKAVSEGIAIPLDDLITRQGPNIRAAFGANLSKLKWTDGKIYYITGSPGFPKDFKGPATGYGSGGYSIRKDVYLALGSPKLDTIDDIYAALKKMKAAYTKTPKGEVIWPAGAFNQTWQNIRDSLAMGAGFYSSGKWYKDPAGKLAYWTRGPQAVTIASYLNRIYREGLLDPEYITIDRDAWSQKLVNGRVLSGFNPWWMNWTSHTDLAAAGFGNADDLVFLNLPFSVPGGQRPEFVEVTSIGGRMKVITKSAKNPEAAFKLVDALAEPEMAFIVNNGIKGGMWNYVNGVPTMGKEFIEKFNAGAGDEEFSPQYGYRLYHPIATAPGNEVRTKWGSFWILKDDPVTTGNARAAERDRLFSPYWYDGASFGEMLKGMNDELAGIWNQMENKIMNDFYQAVTAATEDEFKAKWNAYLAGLDAIGMKKVEEFANQNYQAYVSK